MNRQQKKIGDILKYGLLNNVLFNSEDAAGGGQVVDESGTETEVKEEEFDGAAFRGEPKKEEKTVEETPEQIEEKRIAAEAKANEGKTPEEIAAEKEKIAQENKGNVELDSYWKTFKDVVSKGDDEYDIPEAIKTGLKKDGTPLNDQEKLEFLGNEIVKHTNLSSNKEVNGLIKHMIGASITEKDFTLSNYLKDINDKFVNTSNLSNDDKIFNEIKIELGEQLSDDAIKEEVTKMSVIEKAREVKRIDTKQAESINLETEKYKVQYNIEVQKSLEDWKPKEKEYLDNFINKIKSNSSIEGFDFSEADQEQFINDLPNFYQNKLVDNENGYKEITSGVNNVLSELMSDQELAMALTPFLWLFKNNRLKGYTSRIKEETKKKIEEKLNPNPGGEGTSSFVTDAFNSKKFREG